MRDKTMTLCLNMIVKNESHIIEKTLKRLTEVFVFSYWVISDTGSSDNTKELIKSFFNTLNIPGELVEHEWKDFGYNRTMALESAYNKTDYLLIFDADDYVHGTIILPDLNADMYHLKFGSNFVYKRPLLVNNRLKWQFRGVLHEFLTGGKSNNIEAVIDGDYYIESGKSGARSHDPKKYHKDADILEKAYLIEKDNGLKDRYAFYCAQSYMDAGEKEKSIEWYKKVIESNNWHQEKYYACLMIGDLSFNLKNDKEGIAYYSKASVFDRERIENISRLMEYYYNNGLHLIVNSLYTKFKDYNKTPIDLSGKLFVSLHEYNFQIEYLNSVSAYYVNDYKSGYECCKTLINHPSVSLNIKKNAMKNINFYTDYLIKDNNENLIKKAEFNIHFISLMGVYFFFQVFYIP